LLTDITPNIASFVASIYYLNMISNFLSVKEYKL